MKFRVFKKHEDYLKEFEVWADKFVLFPIFIDDMFVWLEVVERKRLSIWTEVFWEYRLKGKN